LMLPPRTSKTRPFFISLIPSPISPLALFIFLPKHILYPLINVILTKADLFEHWKIHLNVGVWDMWIIELWALCYKESKLFCKLKNNIFRIWSFTFMGAWTERSV
jgi:hypothetical protein